MARGQRDRSKERDWRGQVAAWRRSGQSVRAYCATQGLSEPSFYAWRRALAERQQRASTRARRGDSTDTGAVRDAGSLFVPVRLVEESLPEAAVEVVLRGGRVVRVAAGFAAPTLRAVVAALEDLPC